MKAIIPGLMILGLLMPAGDLHAADRGKYKECVRSCQVQFNSCYKNTKNRAQCREQQAACTQGCNSYLSSLTDRILAMVSKKEDDK